MVRAIGLVTNSESLTVLSKIEISINVNDILIGIPLSVLIFIFSQGPKSMDVSLLHIVVLMGS